MTKLGIGVGILATVFCVSVNAQTINVMLLDQAGAQTVLQAARESAQQRNTPSAIGVVDPAGICLRSSGWAVSAQQARTSPSRRRERLRGCGGRRRRSRTALIRAERHSSLPTSQHCVARADTRNRRSRGRHRCCRLEQGSRYRNSEHRGRDPEFLTGEFRADAGGWLRASQTESLSYSATIAACTLQSPHRAAGSGSFCLADLDRPSSS
jgi:hypothetical protein